jgi:hypothetical protein
MARSTRPAGFWAIVWLGGTAVTIGLPLLVLDRLTKESPLTRRTPRRPLPRLAVKPLRRPTAPLPRQAPSTHARQAHLPFFPLASAPSPASAFSPPLYPAAAFAPAGTGFLNPYRSISGVALLGGPLGLESIGEKEMVPAARTERALRALAADPFLALPRHWRDEIKPLLGSAFKVLPAEIVHIPAPHRRTPEEIPLALTPDGRAEAFVAPASPVSFQQLERWTERQAALPTGTVWPVLVVLEPIDLGQPPATLLPYTLVPRPAAAQAPVDASQTPVDAPQAPAPRLRVSESAVIPVPLTSEDPAPPAAEPTPPPAPVVVTPPPASDSAAIPISISSEDILPP